MDISRARRPHVQRAPNKYNKFARDKAIVFGHISRRLLISVCVRATRLFKFTRFFGGQRGRFMVVREVHWECGYIYIYIYIDGYGCLNRTVRDVWSAACVYTHEIARTFSGGCAGVRLWILDAKWICFYVGRVSRIIFNAQGKRMVYLVEQNVYIVLSAFYYLSRV